MAQDSEEKKESPAESAGKEIGQRAGQQIGSKIGGASAGAAGTGGGAATGGTAVGTGVGTAGAATAGSATGATLGTAAAPVVGTAIGATVGTAVGKFGKPILFAAGGVAGFVVLLIVVILAPILGLGGGVTPTEAAGSGLGVKDNYCQAYLSPEDYDGDGVKDCSKELKNIIVQAATAAKLPAAILLAIGLKENLGDAMVLSDADVLKYSAPGAEIPACAQSPADARGPMQFLQSTFDGHKNFIIDVGVRPAGYSPDICNIEDSLYAAAHKIKTDFMALDDPARDWTQEEVYSEAAQYLSGGAGLCIDPAYPDNHYCEAIWQLYSNKKDVGIEVSAQVAPPCGWPTTGQITTLFGQSTSVESSHSGLDIAADTSATIDGGQPVFNTMTGELIQSSWTDSSGGTITVTSTINGTKYSVTYVHMSQEAVSVMSSRLNKTLNRGEAVGKTYSAITQDYFNGDGVASPGELPHSGGTHLHYAIYVNSIPTNPLDYTPAKLGLNDTIVSPGGCQ